MDEYRVTAGGIETVYAEQGTGDPVVLIHGWGAAHNIWRHFWPVVVPKFRSIAVDLPGWGASAKPEAPYGWEWYADWLKAFLDARRITSAHLVGHSMGALIATEFALRYPERARRLVLCNPLVDGATALDARTHALIKPVVRRVLYWLCRFRAVRRWTAKNSTYRAPLADEFVDNVNRATYASMIRPVFAILKTDLRPRLSELRTPTLIVSSDRDGVVRAGQAELAARGIPGARHEIFREVGHYPMLECPEEFNERVGDFLDEAYVKRRPRQW